MNKKTWFNGFGYFLGAGVLATGLAATGCGDDETPAVDAGVDAAPGVDATPCTGHGCPSGQNPWALTAEGGEVRLEYYQLPEGANKLAAHAFFWKDQTPAIRPLLGATIANHLNFEGCHDYETGEYFNGGVSTEAQAILDTRTYIDAGAFMQLVNEDDATDVIELAKQPAGTADQSQNLQHDILYLADTTLNPTYNAGYKIAFDGFGLDMTDGTAIQMNWMSNDPTVYLPPNFTMTNPAEADYFAGVELTRGQDFTPTWENAEPANANGPATLSFMGFVGLTGKVEAYCIKTSNTGELTIPYEVYDVVPDTGYLLMGTFTHTAWKDEQDAKIDVLGVNCKLSQYTLVDAAAAN